MRDPLPERLFTPREVAGYLGASVSKVYRLIHAGKLRASKIGGEWRISHEAVRDLLEDGLYF
ncbi:MAG: helix-turn-helix domain-containing protein [Hyphomicrobiaceae bacterium]